MSNGKLLSGLLIGAAIGSALGILFAPEKGTETRSRISKKSGDLADSLKRKFNDFVDGLSERMDEVSDEADNLVERGKEKAYSVKNEMKSGMS